MKSNTKNRLILILLLILQFGILLYFGSLKKGMHFDECFSYFNTNNSVGRQAYDRSFVNSEDILKDFYVKQGEQFNYSYVIKLQSYDVHPPIFYILLHTLCSFMPGIFSIWQGIALNIVYTIITTVFICLILKRIINNSMIVNFILASYVLNTGVICNAMYIRMYCLMTLWIVIAIYLHIRMSEFDTMNTLPLFYMLVNGFLAYLGFLTHYFYLAFLFFLEAGFWLPKLWRYKTNLKGFIKYSATVLAFGILGVISYPACLGHVNSGYRGQEVKGYLLDLSDLGNRFSFFDGLLNKYVFNGFMFIWLLVIVLLFITVYYKKSQKTERENISGNNLNIDFKKLFSCIIVPTAGYYLISTKASLLGDEAMMRYQLPVYGLIYLAFLIMMMYGLVWIIRDEKKQLILTLIVAIAFALINSKAILDKNVFYLYQEQAKMEQIAKDNKDKVCVYIYNDENSKYFLWNDFMQLAQYDRVYFVNSENSDAIDESSINNAEEVIVYVSVLGEKEDFKDYSQFIYDNNKNVSGYKFLYDGMYSKCYNFY